MTKKEIEKLQKQLAHKSPLVWDQVNKRRKEAIFAFAEEYKSFLDSAKTEREAVTLIQKMARKAGYADISSEQSKTGKYYQIHRNKCIALACPGKTPLSRGARIVGAHIDSPRLDLKQNPLYEQEELAFLKTHYYGGIRKHQWLARPLALHGRIVKANGEVLDLCIGESDGDPVFTIADLLPHLARKVQGEKKLSEAFEGEKLNLIAGSLPLGNTDISERFKLNILNYLHQNYGLVEADFTTAEIEIVPAGKARDLGFDRSLIGAYAHDDRVCAYTALRGLLDGEQPEHTAIVLLFDKEEIGSDGNTGAQSRFLEQVIADLLEKSGETVHPNTLRRTLTGSQALSADVNGALDPDYPDLHEKQNAARLGHGICVTKFTGSGGKYGANDAHAEYLAQVRQLFNAQQVVWQTGELGKVDQGGGGTIAKFLARYGMDIVDCGPAVLSMHSPFEIASKADIYMSYQAYQAFLSG